VGQVTASDPDVPAQTLTFSLAGGPSSGCFQITAAGVLTFKNPPDFENPADADGDNVYTLNVRVEDGHGGSDTELIWVEVTEINEAPTAKITGVPVVSKKDTAISLTGEFNNLDAGDTHSYSWTVTKDGAVVTSSTEAGPVSYTPAQTGSYLVTLKVEDDHGGIGTDAVTIVVVEPGRPSEIKGLELAKAILSPTADSGYIGTVSRHAVVKDGLSVTNGKVGSVWVIDDMTTLAAVTDGKGFGVLELNGHGGFDERITYGAAGTTEILPANAAAFGQALKQQVLKDKPPGVLILQFCLPGTYTREDSPGNAKSVPQIVANMTGWTVLSAGGFARGHFSWYYVPDFSLGEPGTWKDYPTSNWTQQPDLRYGLAYESADDTWYLSVPE
jgi:hypothetical protein